MNAKAVDTAESHCICQTPEFEQYADQHHNHVLTAGLDILTKYPELQDTLLRGTNYKPHHAYSAMDWPQIGECIAESIIQQAMKLDQLPKHVYAPWRSALLAAFSTQQHKLPTTTSSMTADQSKSPMQRLNRATTARDIVEIKARHQFETLSSHFRFSQVDKAAGTFAVMCTQWCRQQLTNSLHSDTYTEVQTTTALDVAKNIISKCRQLNIPVLNTKTTLDSGKVVYKDPATSLPRLYLILKAHKTPVAPRPICSTSGTQIANIAKAIVPALNLCIQTYVDVWFKVADYLTFSTTAS